MQPGDEQLVSGLYRLLTHEDRYHRFLSPVPELQPWLLRQLTSDEPGRVVLLALEGDRCVGEARLIPFATEPKAAEACITVAPQARRRGVATCLVAHLAREAQRANHRVVRAWSHSDNVPARALSDHFMGRRRRYERGVDIIEWDLPTLTKTERQHPTKGTGPWLT